MSYMRRAGTLMGLAVALGSAAGCTAGMVGIVELEGNCENKVDLRGMSQAEIKLDNDEFSPMCSVVAVGQDVIIINYLSGGFSSRPLDGPDPIPHVVGGTSTPIFTFSTAGEYSFRCGDAFGVIFVE